MSLRLTLVAATLPFCFAGYAAAEVPKPAAGAGAEIYTLMRRRRPL